MERTLEKLMAEMKIQRRLFSRACAALDEEMKKGTSSFAEVKTMMDLVEEEAQKLFSGDALLMELFLGSELDEETIFKEFEETSDLRGKLFLFRRMYDECYKATRRADDLNKICKAVGRMEVIVDTQPSINRSEKRLEGPRFKSSRLEINHSYQTSPLIFKYSRRISKPDTARFYNFDNSPSYLRAMKKSVEEERCVDAPTPNTESGSQVDTLLARGGSWQTPSTMRVEDRPIKKTPEVHPRHIMGQVEEETQVEAKEVNEEETDEKKEVAEKKTPSDEKKGVKNEDAEVVADEKEVVSNYKKDEEKEAVPEEGSSEDKKSGEDNEEKDELEVLVKDTEIEDLDSGDNKNVDDDEAIGLMDKCDVNGIDTEDSIHLTIREDEEKLMAGEDDLVEKHSDVNAERSGRGSKKQDTRKSDARSISPDNPTDDKGKKSNYRNLWVSGLSAITQAQDLKHIIYKFGKVIAAKVVTNEETLGARCYRFATMVTAEDAQTHIKGLNPTELHSGVT